MTRTWTIIAALALTLWATMSSARADEVDDAFAAGNAAAAEGDWPAAVVAYRRAEQLLPEPSAVLDYNLGTAYLETGDLGRATLHLLRAQQFSGGPTTDVLEAARYNLQAARQRAELQAAASDAKIDRADGWWDLLLDALRAPGVGWLALVSGWAALALLWVHRRRRRLERPTSVTGVALLVTSLCYLVPGVLHGLALREDRISPRAIVVAPTVEVREGPGNHHAIQFSAQGGSRVRIVERTVGWQKIRLSGGLGGWVPEDAVAPVERSARPNRPGAPPRPAG
jgi:hypothetical protein